jgi:hypothetical protein
MPEHAPLALPVNAGRGWGVLGPVAMAEVRNFQHCKNVRVPSIGRAQTASAFDERAPPCPATRIVWCIPTPWNSWQAEASHVRNWLCGLLKLGLASVNRDEVIACSRRSSRPPAPSQRSA